MLFLPGSLCNAAEPKLCVLFAFTSVSFVAVLTRNFDDFAMIFPEQKKVGYKPEVVVPVSE